VFSALEGADWGGVLVPFLRNSPAATAAAATSIKTIKKTFLFKTTPSARSFYGLL
jgi:hypothetical protein